ncbi:hypothetical protein HYN43_021900 [Mucilaginibacter celer]|uniref:Stationary phase survival protein SurE n=2 Tax=Mucilaginibacter celer TaxID=2305508 RepID=A0A494W1Z8_9SPHI|nr:hypothetical protein HYN43_021900 [Mucilaginibacter celer]
MLNKNDIAAGLLIGALLPCISLFIFWFLLKNQLVLMNKPGIPYLTAFAINLFIIRYFYGRGADKTGNGVAMISFLFLLAIFIFKLQPL